MKQKYIALIVVAILIAVPVAWYLLSPLFITRRVNESMTDLLKMAGVSETVLPPMMPTGMPTGAPGTEATPPKMMDISTLTPPAGLDPRAESSGPTTPPPSMEAVQGVGQGTFVGLAGHNAEGGASLVKIGEKFFIRLEDDFRVTNGPDLYVGFGKSGEYAKGSEVGRLKGNEGGQNYEVPQEINALQYNEIWVWCKAFSVPFGKAVLN